MTKTKQQLAHASKMDHLLAAPRPATWSARMPAYCFTVECSDGRYRIGGDVDDAERIRRKAIWDRMSDLERQKADQEKSDIIQKSINEEEEAMERIKAEGRHRGGLDGYYPELVEISDRTKQKINELLERVFKEDRANLK